MTHDILNVFLNKPEKTWSLRELLRLFKDVDKQDLKEVLANLTENGKILETKRHHYQSAAGKTVSSERGFEAKMQLNAAGFGFAIPTDKERPDVYIPKDQLGGAFHGDVVRVENRPAGRDRKPWGVVVGIVERGLAKLVGKLFFSAGYAFLKPDDHKVPNLKLAPTGLEKLELGSRIQVVVHFPPPGKKGKMEPFGEFEKFIGIGDGPDVEIEAVIAKNNLFTEFTPEALAEAEKIDLPKKADFKGRTDFTKLNVFTIDGADAKDFDDAIHVREIEKDLYEVGIHIADVSHYVMEFSSLDHDAYARSTSAYLPGRVLPMLPERLSNNICSLVPDEDRLVLSVLIEVTSSGKVKGHTLHEGVICSAARLTYNQVEDFANNPEENAKNFSKKTAKDLTTLLELTKALRERRMEGGALDFSFVETKVDIDEEGNLHLIPQLEPRARNLIEELMLLANRTVALMLDQKKIPALFRIHEDPTKEQFGKLVRALSRMGYAIEGGEPSPKALQAVIRQAEGKPEASAISTMMLRTLRLARYAEENLGHFGLAAEHYLHFTSPIRRYPDLVVHRVVRALIQKKIDDKTKSDWSGRFPKMALHTSERERAAESAERDLTKYYQCIWADKHKEEIHSGVVSGVASFGFFVSIGNGVEGMVRLTSLRDDHYEYHEELLSLEGSRRGRRIRMGDVIEVEISSANPPARQIDFSVTDKFYEGLDLSKVSEVEKRPATRSDSARGEGTPRPSPSSSGARPKKGDSKPARGSDRSRFDRPVRASAQTIYFGEWKPDEEKPIGKAAGSVEDKPNRRRKKKKKNG